VVDPELSDPPLAPAPQRKRLKFATFRSIAALMLREMSTRYGRRPGGYIWAFLQPIGVIIMMAMAFSLIQRSPSLGTSFILFKATGLLIYQGWRNTVGMMGSALRSNRALLHYPGVTWMDAVLARFLLNSLIQVLVAIVILTGIIVIEGLWLILDWVVLLQTVGLTLLLGFGIGLLHCYLNERYDIWSNIWGISTAPLMILSGVLFTYESLPQVAQGPLWYNPVIHLTGMMRAGFYSTYQPQYTSVILVMLWAMIPMVMGLLLLRRYHRVLLQR
jgi:capsular polysaccharide transport system permease protein